MKYIIALLISLTFLFSCKEDKTSQKNTKTDTNNSKIVTNNDPEKYFKSDFRPNEKISLNTIYENEVVFEKYNDDGDYTLMNVKNGSFIYDWERTKENDFCRGDILSVKWRMDSIWIAGDGETLDFTETAFAVKKKKDGKVSQFRKKYKEPLSYHHSYEDKTEWFFNEIYLQVEYYIANSKNSLFNNYENIKIEYSIEHNIKDGKEYYMIGIYDNSNNQNSIIQWLYIEPEEFTIYEYDLPNDKLIKFN
ncbi:hypothetical protein [Flavobacterium sp. H122]|uniref:hypothetical protein n=1 Tax=Flavobacterium sp. H122 TaxID=2529860 RepID=UPI0010AAE5DC|nr:hypothetical protein [Flavobacterium sp. H122]